MVIAQGEAKKPYALKLYIVQAWNALKNSRSGGGHLNFAKAMVLKVQTQQ
jgi:hypothetical protein